MMHVFTLTNINTKIIKGKLSKIFISELCIKLVVALRINRYTRRSSQFQKVGDLWSKRIKTLYFVLLGK